MVYSPAPVDRDVSRTALAMCAYCALTRRHEGFARVFSDAYSEELFRRAVVDGDRILERLHTWPQVEELIRTEGDGDLIIVRHVVWRKRWIQDQVRRALADGMEQLVIFGSGFDTLSLRTRADASTIPIFEIDQASTLAAKRRLVDEIASLSDVTYVPLDLAKRDAVSHLLESDFDSAKPTLFVAEAVLEYLPPVQAIEIIDFVHRHSEIGSRLLFTFFSSSALDARSQERQANFGKVGEPILFTLPPSGLESFLSAHKLKLRAWLTPQYVRDSYLSEIGMLCPEMTPNDVRDLLHICVAESD